jgi:dTDP-4-amino-4,6-dideoxygalactose transaminase
MKAVEDFEKTIASFYNAPYAIATDCCTHAIELCLRYLQSNDVSCPNHTYLSVPMTFIKLGLRWTFTNDTWKDYYYIGNTNIVDAAVYWKQNGYINNTFMCLSFQYKKHLNVGRGGMILLDNIVAYDTISKMRYDGRQNNIPWAEQNIDIVGYHYYMTPETANLGMERFECVKDMPNKTWTNEDYPDLRNNKVFTNA